MKKFWLIFSLLVFVEVNVCFAQKHELLITESFLKTDLKSVLSTLSTNYGLRFAYDDALVKHVIINTEIKNRTIENALTDILADTDIDFKHTGSTYLLFKSKEKKSEPKSQSRPKSEIYTLSGVVKDCKSGDVLPYVFVSDAGNTLYTWANSDGYFSLNLPSNDSLVLELSYLGYNSVKQKVKPHSCNKFHVFEMQNAEQNLQEIEVRSYAGKVLEINEKAYSSASINPQLFKTVPNYGQADAFNAVQLLPGISGATESAADLRIHGGNMDQNLVLYDGFTVYQLDHFYGMFSAFNSDAVKTIEVHKSGFGAQYGGRVSGVIDMIGKSANFKKLSGSANINPLSVSGSMEIPIVKDRASLLLAGRRSFSDILPTYLYNNILSGLQGKSAGSFPLENVYYFNDERNESVFRFYDTNAKLTLRKNSTNILTFSFFNGNDKFYNKYIKAEYVTETDRFYAENNIQNTTWGNTGFAANWSKRWLDILHTKLNLSYSEYYSNFDNSWNNSYLDTLQVYKLDYFENQRNTIRDFGSSVKTELKFNSQHTLHACAEHNYLTTTFDYKTHINSTITSTPLHLTTLYVIDNIVFRKRISVSGGFRSTLNSVTSEVYLAPRISVKYSISDCCNVLVSAGKYHQFLSRTYSNNIMSGSHDFWVISDNVQVPVSEALHYTLTANYEMKSFQFSASVFAKKISGISMFQKSYPELVSVQFADSVLISGDTYVPDNLFDDSDYVIENKYFTGNSNIIGADIILSNTTRIGAGWLTFSVFDKKMEIGNSNMVFTPESSSQLNFELKAAQTINLGKWYFSAVWVLNTSEFENYSDANSYVINLSNGKISDQIYLTPHETELALRYHRLDISGGRKIRLGDAELTVGASLLNVYNRQNIKLTQYYVSFWDSQNNTVSDTPHIVANGVKLIGFTPVVFLNIGF